MSFENKTFRDYKFLKLLGKGTYGEIYLTQKGNSPVLVATKIFDKKRYDNNDYLLKCLDKEIELLTELDHPNIVKFYEKLKDDKNYYLIMEYCNGGNLNEILKKYKQKYNDSFSLDITQYLMRQIISSIDYIHSKKIVHRDIKLDNILISFKNEEDLKNLNIKAGQIKIIDFGVSTKLDPYGEASTVAGSPIYMDPLILKQHVKKEKIPKYDERIDIWSLGAVFYQFLTGQRLYHVKSIEELEKKVEEGNYIIPKSKIIYKEPISFLNGMLQYDTEDRFDIKELSAHNFIVKEIKDFTKINLSLIAYKFNDDGLEINSKENDTIYRAFNSGDKGFNELGNQQAVRMLRKNTRKNTYEKERGYSHYGDIYGLNKEEKILSQIFQFNQNFAKNANNEKSNENSPHITIDKPKSKNNISDKEKEELKKYVNGLLFEYKAAKEYFNKNGSQQQEEDANKKINLVQNYLQDLDKGNFMNNKSLPEPITPEYIYGCPITKRDSVFNEVLNQYKAEAKGLEKFIRTSILNYQQLDSIVFSVIKDEVMPQLNSNKQKLDELKKLIADLDSKQSNKWIPPPDIVEDLENALIEEISYEGCEFKMITKASKTNYNSACSLLLKLSMKIDDKKTFYGDIKVINYGDYEEEMIWNLKHKDYENIQNYSIKVDFYYVFNNNQKEYQGSTNLNISKLKDENEIDIKFQKKLKYNQGDTMFNFNIKVIKPEGKKKIVNGMKKVIKLKKILPPFEGKSPDTQNLTPKSLRQREFNVGRNRIKAEKSVYYRTFLFRNQKNISSALTVHFIEIMPRNSSGRWQR